MAGPVLYHRGELTIRQRGTAPDEHDAFIGDPENPEAYLGIERGILKDWVAEYAGPRRIQAGLIQLDPNAEFRDALQRRRISLEGFGRAILFARTKELEIERDAILDQLDVAR